MTRKLFADFKYLCNMTNRSPVVYPETAYFLWVGLEVVSTDDTAINEDHAYHISIWIAEHFQNEVVKGHIISEKHIWAGVCMHNTEYVETVPELLSDWDDLDSEMRLRRFAAATQPSLLVRRFFTNLQKVRQTVKWTTTHIYLFSSPN